MRIAVSSETNAGLDAPVAERLEIGLHGGIVVDEHMRTSDPEIYAGGDCVESRG